MDARVDFALLLDTFGLPATVTRPAPDDTPIITAGIWMTPLLRDEPSGSSFTRREQIRAFAVSKATVPTLPRGTTILAAERDGDPVLGWIVDGIDHVDADHTRGLVMRAPELDS